MRITGIRSWNLNGAPFDATVAFYEKVLGAEVATRHQVAGADVVRLRLGGFGIGVFDASGGDRPGVPHHTFDFVDGPADPQHLVQQLRHLGAQVDGVRMHGAGPGYSVYILDPSGNRIELSTDPA